MELAPHRQNQTPLVSQPDLLKMQQLRKEEDIILKKIDDLIDTLPTADRERYYDLILSVNKERETIVQLDAYGSLKSVDDAARISAANTRLMLALNELTRLMAKHSLVFEKRDPLMDDLLDVRTHLRTLGYNPGYPL